MMTSAFLGRAFLISTSYARTPLRCRRRRTSYFANRLRAPILMCENPPAPDEKPQAPDGTTLTRALEVSFRAVWVNLMAAGANEQYRQAILQFVVTSATAFKAGYSLKALQLELAANEIGKEDNGLGVDTRLNDREKTTRLIWITLVYLTLMKFKFESENPPPPVDIDLKGSELSSMLRGLTNLVDQVVSAAAKGYDLNKFKMEMALSDPPLAEGEEEVKLQNAQKNLRSQWARIVFTTIDILPDSTKGFSRMA